MPTNCTRLSAYFCAISPSFGAYCRAADTRHTKTRRRSLACLSNRPAIKALPARLAGPDARSADRRAMPAQSTRSEGPTLWRRVFEASDFVVRDFAGSDSAWPRAAASTGAMRKRQPSSNVSHGRTPTLLAVGVPLKKVSHPPDGSDQTLSAKEPRKLVEKKRPHTAMRPPGSFPDARWKRRPGPTRERRTGPGNLYGPVAERWPASRDFICDRARP